MTNEDFCQDFRDLLQAFTEAEVDYLVVGAHALAAHGYARATGDLDIFVRPTKDNAANIYRALQVFGAPLIAHQVQEQDFATEGMVYQLGLPPNRIDILTSLSGVDYDECVKDAPTGQLGGQTVQFIGIAAQLKNKRASGRTKDIADAEMLEELLETERI